jgi:hypothetical protein
MLGSLIAYAEVGAANGVLIPHYPAQDKKKNILCRAKYKEKKEESYHRFERFAEGQYNIT